MQKYNVLLNSTSTSFTKKSPQFGQKLNTLSHFLLREGKLILHWRCINSLGGLRLQMFINVL